MTHKCIGENTHGIRWSCSEDAAGNFILQSEGIPDAIRVSYCPFCGLQSESAEDVDEIVYQLKKYQLVKN